MLNRVLPRAFDNTYRGRRLALWLLYPITLLNLVIDVMAIAAPDGEAQSADGIPLFAYPPAAAQAVVGVVGPMSTSTSVKARAKSSAMSRRTFWALR